MELDLQPNPRTRQVVEAFIAWWKAGGRSKLDGAEIGLLNVFCDFVLEYQEKPPDLGLAVSVSIGVKDKAY